MANEIQTITQDTIIGKLTQTQNSNPRCPPQSTTLVFCILSFPYSILRYFQSTSQQNNPRIDSVHGISRNFTGIQLVDHSVTYK